MFTTLFSENEIPMKIRLYNFSTNWKFRLSSYRLKKMMLQICIRYIFNVSRRLGFQQIVVNIKKLLYYINFKLSWQEKTSAIFSKGRGWNVDFILFSIKILYFSSKFLLARSGSQAYSQVLQHIVWPVFIYEREKLNTPSKNIIF